MSTSAGDIPSKTNLALARCQYVPIYSWPNGQGDIGNFLESIENGEIWGKGHGQVYRIWSDTKGEM